MQISLAFFSADGDRPAPLDFCIAASEWADRSGLCAVWVPERHFHAFGGAFPDPAVVAAAIAARTERVEIRAGSVVVTLHDALDVAERWSMVDCLSNGRVGMAFASGWREEDFILKPSAYADRHELMWRQIGELRTLWRGGSVERRDGSGKTWRLKSYPRPVQPELRAWVAAAKAGPVVTRAANVDAGIFTHLVAQSVSELEGMIAQYRDACRGAGHVALMLHTYVADSDEAARGRARTPLRNYFRQWRDLSGGGAERLPQEQEELMLQVSVERYFRGRSLIGSVDTCCEMLSQLAEIGVDEVACLTDFGIEDDVALEGLRLLGHVAERAQAFNVGADRVCT